MWNCVLTAITFYIFWWVGRPCMANSPINWPLPNFQPNTAIKNSAPLPTSNAPDISRENATFVFHNIGSLQSDLKFGFIRISFDLQNVVVMQRSICQNVQLMSNVSQILLKSKDMILDHKMYLQMVALSMASQVNINCQVATDRLSLIQQIFQISLNSSAQPPNPLAPIWLPSSDSPRNPKPEKLSAHDLAKCYSKDVDYIGHDLNLDPKSPIFAKDWGRRATVSACQQLCQHVKSCRLFVYQKYQKWCFLKNENARQGYLEIKAIWGSFHKTTYKDVEQRKLKGDGNQHGNFISGKAFCRPYDKIIDGSTRVVARIISQGEVR